MESNVSIKLCLHLCYSKWLKFKFRRLNNLIPLVSCMSKTEILLDLIKLRIVTLNLLLILYSYFVIEFTPFFTAIQKNEFLNTLVFAGIALILLCVVEQVKYASSPIALLYVLSYNGKSPCINLRKKKNLQGHDLSTKYFKPISW